MWDKNKCQLRMRLGKHCSEVNKVGDRMRSPLPSQLFLTQPLLSWSTGSQASDVLPLAPRSPATAFQMSPASLRGPSCQLCRQQLKPFFKCKSYHMIVFLPGLQWYPVTSPPVTRPSSTPHAPPPNAVTTQVLRACCCF